MGRKKHNLHRFGNKYVNKNRLLHHDTKVVTINLSTIIIFSSRPSLEKENAIVVNGVADAVAVNLKRPKASERAEMFATYLRRRQSHPE